MAISAEWVKKLREATGAGMMECKTALEEAAGDFEKAIVILRKKGAAAAGRKADRITSEGVEERLMRILLLQSKIPTCYVAVTPDGRPCYMQWLIGPSENDQVKKFFVDRFPSLVPDVALLEFALTLEAYRGQGIMPCAMAQIAKQAADLGARWVITFVMDDNIPSLKGCKRAGFVPYLTRRERWQLFHRRITFTPLPPGSPYPFDGVQGHG